MDCLRAREIVSEAFDRGVANVPESAEAREHCRSCPECRRFVEGLGMLEKVAPPLAPPHLVEEIVERARRMAAANVPPIVGRKAAEDAVDGEPAAAESPALEVPLVLTPAPRPGTWTAGRITALAAAVLVGMFAVTASVQGFLALKGPGATAGGEATATFEAQEPGYRLGGEAVTDSAKAAGSLEAQRSSGTRYVAFEGQAYFWLGARKPGGETLVAVGTLISSLDGTSVPKTRDVWRSKADGDVIFIRGEDEETYVAFRRATRTLGGKVFALYTDELPSYGLWPALPSQYATPTAADGTPTFAPAGKDDAGLDIFAPSGAEAAAGFAVGPNTTQGDPAAGNPNWTWWVPRP